MNIAPHYFTLRDGRSLMLRSLQVEEAATVMEHLNQTAEETYFLSRYPDEITITLEKEEEFLSKLLEHPTNFILGNFVEGCFAGTCSVMLVNSLHKFCHRGEFGVSLKKEFWHGGIGRIDTAFCIAQAKKNGLERLELSVFSDNERAIPLYHRSGFQTVGQVPKAFKLKDGTYRDEIIMSLDLTEYCEPS